MKLLILSFVAIAVASAKDLSKSCDVLCPCSDSAISMFDESMEKISTRGEMKEHLSFLVEFSRFMNRKIPFLLQEFADSKRIFQTRKRLQMVKMRAKLTEMDDFRQKREIDSGDQSTQTIGDETMKSLDEFLQEDVFDESSSFRRVERDVDEEEGSGSESSGGGPLHDIFDNLADSSLTEVFELFSSVVQEVGDVLETSLPPTSWNYLCVATWWPYQAEHCATVRCAACSPAIMAASSACKQSGMGTTHKCVQTVMGEGFCNYCIDNVLKH